MSEEKSYCGFVAIVGRPNVGKSTLLNKLLGQKISITSRKAQTTRHRIVGIHTEGPYQAIYVDTPGLHMEEKRAINRLMNKAASSSIGDVELVIFVVEGTRWTQDDEMVLNKLRDAKAPVISRSTRWITCRKSGSVTAPAVPRQPDEFPRYRTDLSGNRHQR